MVNVTLLEERLKELQHQKYVMECSDDFCYTNGAICGILREISRTQIEISKIQKGD